MNDKQFYILKPSVSTPTTKRSLLRPATETEIATHKLKGCTHQKHFVMSGKEALVYEMPYSTNFAMLHCACCDRKLRRVLRQ